MSYPATASQTVGPYFKIGLQYLHGHDLCTDAAEGTHITVSGQVFDGDGVSVPDAQLELWQADSEGRFAGYDPSERGDVSEGFGGFARVPVNEHGAFHFSTIYPGSVASPDGGQQAPHIVVILSMRGLLKHLYTRIYFAGDALNDGDQILKAVPAERRPTLLAQEEPDGTKHYRLDIHLQGDNETVFFEY